MYMLLSAVIGRQRDLLIDKYSYDNTKQDYPTQYDIEHELQEDIGDFYML